jgi:hypothetical protein
MSERTRGQTTLDFAVGMSTFLLVFAFVLTFIPGMIQPFSASDQEATVIADRVADHLSQGLLGDPARPYILNSTCTVAFLDDSTGTGCRYSGDNISDRVGLSRYDTNKPYRSRINVSLEGNLSDTDGSNVLCWDDTNETLVERDDSSCDEGDPTDVVLQDGATLPENRDSIIVARRTVSVGGQNASLLVRVW